jgi:4-hydroxy-4-methyl-2-oxoglutarate aldolase
MDLSAGAPNDRLKELTTAHVADACLRLGVPVRCGPQLLRPAAPGMRASGRVRPVRHFGSVDVFLEALEETPSGSILVVDNGARLDEACVGDLVTLEAKDAGLAGIVIWGLHRDSREIAEIGLPLFSLGPLPTGPQRLDARPADVFGWARVGAHVVTADDVAMADADGVLFAPQSRLDDIVAAATAIRETEHRQAEAMRAGRKLREQLRFREYLARRANDVNYDFRQHLREIGAAIEE